MMIDYKHDDYLKFDLAREIVFLRPGINHEPGFYDNSTITFWMDRHPDLAFTVVIESNISVCKVNSTRFAVNRKEVTYLIGEE